MSSFYIFIYLFIYVFSVLINSLAAIAGLETMNLDIILLHNASLIKIKVSFKKDGT